MNWVLYEFFGNSFRALNRNYLYALKDFRENFLANQMKWTATYSDQFWKAKESPYIVIDLSITLSDWSNWIAIVVSTTNTIVKKLSQYVDMYNFRVRKNIPRFAGI